MPGIGHDGYNRAYTDFGPWTARRPFSTIELSVNSDITTVQPGPSKRR